MKLRVSGQGGVAKGAVQEGLPRVTPGSCRPGSHAIVRTDKVVARKYSVIAVRCSAYQLAVDKLSSPVATLVKGAEWVREGHRRHGHERSREGSRGPFREERYARLEAEGKLGEGGAKVGGQLGEGRRARHASLEKGAGCTWSRRLGQWVEG